MIRPIKIEEIECLNALGFAFFAEAGLPGVFNPAPFGVAVRSILENGSGIVLVAENEGKIAGVIAGVVYEDFLTGDLISSELFWFVTKEARGSVGVRLLKQFEEQSKLRGAKRILMIHLLSVHSEMLTKLYTLRGYAPIEQTFFKKL